MVLNVIENDTFYTIRSYDEEERGDDGPNRSDLPAAGPSICAVGAPLSHHAARPSREPAEQHSTHRPALVGSQRQARPPVLLAAALTLIHIFSNAKKKSAAMGCKPIALFLPLWFSFFEANGFESAFTVLLNPG